MVAGVVSSVFGIRFLHSSIERSNGKFTMARRKLRINLFDLMFVAILVLAVITVAIGWGNKRSMGSRQMIVTVEISDQQAIDNILPVVERSDNHQVFYAGSNNMVLQKSHVVLYNAVGDIDRLDVTLRGLGDIDENASIFNGQRIYANQKTEIRSDYYMQGFVADFRYES